MHTELRGNVAFYRDRSIESGFYTSEEWDQDLADAAAPVSLVATARWLSGMHIFATANVLRRPILLVDQRGVNGTLLFLPLRVGAAACRALSGQTRRDSTIAADVLICPVNYDVSDSPHKVYRVMHKIDHSTAHDYR